MARKKKQVYNGTYKFNLATFRWGLGSWVSWDDLIAMLRFYVTFEELYKILDRYVTTTSLEETLKSYAKKEELPNFDDFVTNEELNANNEHYDQVIEDNHNYVLMFEEQANQHFNELDTKVLQNTNNIDTNKNNITAIKVIQDDLVESLKKARLWNIRGPWSNTIDYKIGDVVGQEETKILYVALTDNTNKIPNENPDIWFPVSGVQSIDLTDYYNKQQVDGLIENLKSLITSLSNRVDNHDTLLNTIDSAINVLKGRVTKLEDQMVAVETNIKETNENITKLDTTVKTFDKRITDNTNNISALTSRVKTAEDKIQQVDDKVNPIIGNYVSLSGNQNVSGVKTWTGVGNFTNVNGIKINSTAFKQYSSSRFDITLANNNTMYLTNDTTFINDNDNAIVTRRWMRNNYIAKYSVQLKNCSIFYQHQLAGVPKSCMASYSVNLPSGVSKENVLNVRLNRPYNTNRWEQELSFDWYKRTDTSDNKLQVDIFKWYDNNIDTSIWGEWWIDIYYFI